VTYREPSPLFLQLSLLNLDTRSKFTVHLDNFNFAQYQYINTSNTLSVWHRPSSASGPRIMGLAYNTYLNSSKIYGCKTCKAHLANHEDIISRVCYSQTLQPLNSPVDSCPLMPVPEFPWSTWQGLPLSQRRQYRDGSSERT